MKTLRPIDWESKDAGSQIVSDLHQTGFCVICNHSLDFDELKKFRAMWREWFEGCGAKESYRHDYTQAGWFGREHAEKAVGKWFRDDKEYFQIFGNTIGNVPPGLQKMTRSHFRALNGFAMEVAAKIDANSSGPGYLHRAIIDSPATMLRILHYPALTEEELEQVEGVPDCRAGEHTDVNLFTMIPCNAEPGLQFENQHGEWEYVPWHSTYLVLNAADMMEILSDGYFKSARHRVATPASHTSSRMSLPFFVHPRPEVTLDDKGTTAEAYLQDRLRELEVRTS